MFVRLEYSLHASLVLLFGVHDTCIFSRASFWQSTSMVIHPWRNEGRGARFRKKDRKGLDSGGPIQRCSANPDHASCVAKTLICKCIFRRSGDSFSM